MSICCHGDRYVAWHFCMNNTSKISIQNSTKPLKRQERLEKNYNLNFAKSPSEKNLSEILYKYITFAQTKPVVSKLCLYKEHLS